MVAANDFLGTKEYVEGRKVLKFYEYDETFVFVFEDGTSLQINYEDGPGAISGSFWINNKDKTERILNNIKIRRRQLE